MKEKFDWKELERLDIFSCKGMLSDSGKENHKILLYKTEDEEKHPEWYEGACLCRLCMSYAD